MGFFSRFFANNTSQPDLDFTDEPQVYIFDAGGMTESDQRGTSSPTPRDNFDILKTLAQFAAQEDLKITAVFTGRPLREAGEGASYRNVKVHYANDTAAGRKLIVKLAQSPSGNRRAVVLTSDPELEQAVIAQGADCMRLSTFKKALENRDGRETRDSRDNRRQRGYRRNNGGKSNGNGNQSKDKESDNREPVESGERNKEILDLIDPI